MIRKRVAVPGSSWVEVDIHGAPDGDAIVVVPGVMSDAAAWRAVAQHLDAWETVVVVNRRGRHPSGPIPEDYSLQLEVEDAAAVVRTHAQVRTVFGWSYGGLIALHLATREPMAQVIAYEPVARPFAAVVLPELRDADQSNDRDATVEIVARRIAGLSAADVESLRSDEYVWETMKQLSEPVYAETAALNAVPLPSRLAAKARDVDLVVGSVNRDRPPYGTTFADVSGRVARAAVHELPGQGHMAHLDAPSELAALLNRLGTRRSCLSGGQKASGAR